MAKKKKSRKKAAGRKRGRPRGARGLTTASINELQSEIQRRIAELQRRRNDLVAELQQIDALIGQGGAVAAAPRRRGRPPRSAAASPAAAKPARRVRKKRRTGKRTRPRNTMNLVEALQGVLAGKTMSVTDVSRAVQDAGYKTNSANFRTIVNQALINNADKFRKVDRGQYTAK